MELSVMLGGAEMMLWGIGRADEMREAAALIAFNSQAEVGRFMAKYVRDVMQEEINGIE